MSRVEIPVPIIERLLGPDENVSAISSSSSSSSASSSASSSTSLSSWISSIIVSSISDYFDGYLARTLNQSSKLGTLLDPIADKLLIAAVIIVLIDTRVIADVHVIPAIIILLREIAISGLREFLAKLNTDMPVSKLAKYKTTFQMVSLSILIISLGFELNDFLWNLGLVTLWLAAIITLLSGYNYVAKGLKHIWILQ